jgi:methionyl-tRNA formyltransferase
MFDTVILLAGAVEHTLLSSVLHAHNPQLQVFPVFPVDDLAAVEPEWLQRARLVAFATPIVVSPELIDGLGFGAYRFHPGSPQYPDEQAAQFALQDGASEFGVTAHRISSRDAAGPIVDVDVFAIPPGTTLAGLEDLARGPLLKIFWRLAGPLATQAEPLVQRAMRWGPKREMFADVASTLQMAPSRHRAFTGPQAARSAGRRGPALRTVFSDGKAVEA